MEASLTFQKLSKVGGKMINFIIIIEKQIKLFIGIPAWLNIMIYIKFNSKIEIYYFYLF